MTETYNGYWSPVRGDTKERVPDVYHRYPSNTERVNVSGADRAEAVTRVVAQPTEAQPETHLEDL